MAQGQPAAKEFRRTAFILGDMRLVMTENRSPRGRDARQSQRIRRRAGGDKKHAQIRLEYLAQSRLDPCGKGIGPIGAKRALIGPRHRLDDFGGGSIAVITGEIHQCPPSIT